MSVPSPLLTDLNPSRPLTDRKDYKLAVLPNGMKVVLVSAAGSGRDRAAASLTVGVGSFSDPPEVEGLAHYLEHMVFMGSEKYPEENKYDAYVDSHGGFCNAFTEGEYTNYVFDIAGGFLPEAFDIFAQCFISPRLSADSSARELQAIDSEFHLAEMSDAARAQEVLCSCANERHFFRKFSWGNLQSLQEVPRASGVDPNEQLRAFYETHYTPDNMSLVVVSPRSVSEMMHMVETSFGAWSPAPSGRPKPEYEGYPFMGRAPAVTRFQSVKNVHRLELHWVIPVCNEALHYRKKADHYIAHLLGHEGAGSVLSFLKAKGYATAMSAGISDGSFSKNSKFSMFEVSVSLTAAGLANWVEAVGAVYTYLRLIEAREGPPRWVHDEMARMAQLQYDYCDEEEDSEFVEELSVKLAQFGGKGPPLELLPSDDLHFEWDPDGVKDVLAALAPCNAHIQLYSSVFKHTSLCREDPEDGSSGSDEDGSGDDDGPGQRRGAKALLEDDGEDEDDEMDSREDSDEDSDEDSGSEGGSEGGGGVVPSLEEVSALYAGPECWRCFADPAVHAARREETEMASGEPSYRVEPNFGTKYWFDEVPADLLQAWDSWSETAARLETERSETDTVKVDVLLSLPHPNPFIPDIAPAEPSAAVGTEKSAAVPTEVPVRLDIEGCSGRLAVHRHADAAGMWTSIPKCVVAMKFSSSMVAKNIHLHVANDLLWLMLLDALNETLYMVYMAGISCDIEADDFGFSVAAAGFRDKMHVFIKELARQLFDPECSFLSETRLKTQSEFLLRRYNNEAVKAGSAAAAVRKMALLPSQYSGKACQQVLAAYTTGEETLLKLKQYKVLFLQSCAADLFIHGAYPAADTTGIVQLLSAGLDSYRSPAPAQDTALLMAAERRTPPVSRLPMSSLSVLRTAPRSPSEKNVCVELYFQAASCDVRTISCLDILEQTLSEPFFNELRTKQQLGYSVSCSTRLTYDVPGICFTVVSSSFGVTEVQSAMFDFIAGVPALLEAQGEQLYAEHIKSLLNEKSTPDVSIRDQAMRFWTEVVDRRLNFNSKEEQVAFFRSPPSLREFVAFSADLLIPSPAGGVRAILVQCVPEEDSAPASTERKTGAARVKHSLFAGLGGKIKYLREPSELHVYSSAI